MQRNIAEVANETREVALFDFLGGQLPVTCERCDICTVTGEGTSFWNTVRHSFTINLVLAVFLREVPIRTYVMSNTTNQFVTSEGKRSIGGGPSSPIFWKSGDPVPNFSNWGPLRP